MRYVRYNHDGRTSYGRLEGETIRELSGAPFERAAETGRALALGEVKLLAPCEPGKVLAVGLNYRSHLGDRPAPSYPGIFIKLPTSIIGTHEPIVLPPQATNVHYEGEMVLVIGRTAKGVSKAEARDHVFGVTCGNDVSERQWQKNDLQWFRAKASDTFGPTGPLILTGVDYDNLQLQTRVNGKVVQSQRTSDLIFDVATIVSYISQFVTLDPGDLIFTGTPGTTSAITSGDVVEVELEGVGVLENRVA
jgi:2-keto-4-pentenoate hydratase/2-oxohepta-3-ene-1,7-dioic acid hydratase in catechol pathway